MNPENKNFEFESVLETFICCWLKFHLSGDIYVAQIKKIVFDENSISLHLNRMSKCKQFVVDIYGTKKWFPTHHYSEYCLNDFDSLEMQALFSQIEFKDGAPLSITFNMQNGDELTFSNDPVTQKEIEDILNTTL